MRKGERMKMVSIIDGVFWGVLLICLGVWFIVRRYVPVQIPIVRIIFAVFFIYLGVRVLAHGPGFRDRNTAVFSDTVMEYNDVPGARKNDYNVIFGTSVVDLTGVTVASETIRQEVNVIFGSGTLKIKAGTPVRVDMSSAFGTVEAPNGSSVAFGDNVYVTPEYKDGEKHLRVRANTVFGKLRIVEQ
jgi:predicted membrane protein